MANENQYALSGLADVMADHVSTVGVQVVFDHVREAFSLWNARVNAAISNFVERTTLSEERYWLPGDGVSQPISADGNPVPRRFTGNYEVGYHLRGYGDGYGLNRISMAQATVMDVERWTLEILKADKRRIEREILKALLYKPSSGGWTFDDITRPQDPSVQVQGLANGDTVTYIRLDGSSSTEDHYKAEATALDDDTFTDIYNELREHPSNMVSQTGYVVSYVATSLVATVEALTNLKDPTDDLVIPGISADRVDNRILGLVGGLGERVLGYLSHNIIVEWSALPTGYIVSYAPNAPKVLKMREYPQSSLQGLFPEMANIDGNHQEIRSLRWFGMAVANRVGAIAYEVDSAYATPDGFDNSSAE